MIEGACRLMGIKQGKTIGSLAQAHRMRELTSACRLF
jgi:hypothetical protein